MAPRSRALAELNRLANPSFIRIGQALAIPQAAAAPPAAAPASAVRLRLPAPAQVVHTVQAGETLWVISGRYGVSIQSIVDANQLAKRWVHPDRPAARDPDRSRCCRTKRSRR